ncbi:MAG: FUSC family protein [Eubacteriaceae bacterium]|nr:FUSC family protein [Eubacteriaceae bacterium]
MIMSIFNILKQAFEFRDVPNPWQKSVGAAICTGVPMLIGYFSNQPEWRLVGGLGGFAYLYFVNETYYRRAKKMFWVVVGFTLTVFLATLLAPHPLLIILTLGFIGALATFLFGVFRIPGPAAIFFVMIYLIAASLPVDPMAAPVRALVVFLSATFTWFVSMAGAPFDIHGPETRALKSTYLALADFSDAIGKGNIHAMRNRVVNTLKESEDTLLTARIPWKESLVYNRLVFLNEQANMLFLKLLELSYQEDAKIPVQFGDMIRDLSKRIKLNVERKEKSASAADPSSRQSPFEKSQVLDEEYRSLLEIIYELEITVNTPLQDIAYEINITKPSRKMKLMEAMDKDSIFFINGIRYGVILAVSGLVALYVPYEMPYWIPIACAAVMLGSTIIATFYRAIQRSIGTFIGIGFAGLVLSREPQGYEIILLAMILTGLTEFIVMRNYAVAAIFITANTLLIAEYTTKISDITYFMQARVINTIIGSVIALAGTYIMGRRSASSRLNGLMAKLLRSQSRVLVLLAENQGKENWDKTLWIKEKMQINLTNFKMTYTTALGEISGNKEMIQELWPVVFSLEYISYLMEHVCITKGYLNISPEDLSRLNRVYEKMVHSIENAQLMQPEKAPVLDEIPKITQEINILQDILSKKIYS